MDQLCVYKHLNYTAAKDSGWQHFSVLPGIPNFGNFLKRDLHAGFLQQTS